MAEGDTLTVDIGRAEPLAFSSTAEAMAWVEQEITAWIIFDQKPDSRVQQITTNIREFISPQLNQLLNDTNELVKNPGHLEAWRNTASTAFNTNRIPLSSDPIFRLAKNLQAQGDWDTAAAVVSAHLGRMNLQNQSRLPFAVIRGLVAAAMLAERVHVDTPKAVAEQLQILADKFTGTLNDAADKFSSEGKNIEAVIAEGKAALARTDEQVRSEWTDKIKQSIEKIEATDAAYTKQMQLQASVNYWTQRGDDERIAAKRSLRVLLIFAAAVIVSAVVTGFLLVPVLLQRTIAEAPSVYAVAATLTLLATTVAFWIARIMLRLYFSAHHLAADARERVVMIQTYLALIKDSKLDEKERTLVLSPLFRPSSDGIVKEDSAPDIGAAAILSKLLDRK